MVDEYFDDNYIHTTPEGRHFRHGDGVEVDGEGNPLKRWTWAVQVWFGDKWHSLSFRYRNETDCRKAMELDNISASDERFRAFRIIAEEHLSSDLCEPAEEGEE